MAKKLKVILVLIDALGADYFSRNRHRLPYLSKLANSGLFVERIRPAVPGTSRPGRATILTGTDTAANCVYGNSILRGNSFRPATATDIPSATIARSAIDAGLDVAGLGFGLLRPEDTSCHIDAWWEHVALKGLSNIKVPQTSRSAAIAPILRDPHGRLARAFSGPPMSVGVQHSSDGILHAQMIGMASDQLMLQAAGDLACGDAPPDLIITEFSVTDTIQHYHGFESAATSWGYQAADMAVGLLLHRLETAGRLDDYVVVITSDHGQAPIHTAIYPEAMVPHEQWSSEGASLHIVVQSKDDRRAIDECCSGLGIEALDGLHLPEEAKARGVVTFVAPKGHAFERRPLHAEPRSRTGEPTIVSTHGLRPDDPADHGIAILIGGDAQGIVPCSDLRVFAPTIASVLGLDLNDYPTSPLAVGGTTRA